jgi:hypothetical protein
MDAYARLAELPMTVAGHSLEILRQTVTSGFERVTTVVSLSGPAGRRPELAGRRSSGAAIVGRGEDVTYDAETHPAVLPERFAWTLAGTYTVGSFSAMLEDLLPVAEIPYPRWGFESAALDLALRQAGLSLPAALERPFRPLRFVVSTRLGSPPTADVVLGWLAADPALEFKLDPQDSWSDELAATLVETGRVRVLDLKAAYEGTPVDQPFDRRLYELVTGMVLRIREAGGWAVIEDPALCPPALEVLEPAGHLLSFDAVIHSADDIRALPMRPAAINIKPSRFGSLERLLGAIEYCDEQGITMYGGGQFELGPGRPQIPALAGVFYADSPNDVAPGGFNVGEPRPGLPSPPLVPAEPAPVGFGFVGAAGVDT